MPDVNFTVDGKKLTAPAGTLLIDACKSAGIEIPAFCYYPGLSLQAACRMCVVRIEKMPKLQTACTTTVAEGMVVQTETPEIAQARKATLQLLLGNHPLDCPVCDAGGECELQDMTFKYGAADSFYAEPKNHRDEQKWSPVVYFDRPRCILCYRCVRMCGEGMDVFGLGFKNRGSSSATPPTPPPQPHRTAPPLAPPPHGELKPVSWEVAFDYVGKKFRELRDNRGGKSIGVIGSNRTTNEENSLLQKFARTVPGP